MRRAKWNTKCAMCVKNTHRVVAYLIILSAFLAVYYGIYEYRMNPAHPSTFPLEVLQIVLLISLLVILEALYILCVIKDEIPFDGEDAPIISTQEFRARVKQGEKLCILDEYVLDVSWWADEHPGGKFSIEANIGRDVSKYFHGGYSLETIDKLPHHMHSTDSRLVVNKLIVAKLQNVSEKIMKINESTPANKTETARTITFAVQGENTGINSSTPTRHECAILDVRNVAKHYLVKTSCLGWFATERGFYDPKKHGHKRHYTEAFAMRPGVYNSLISLAAGNNLQ